MTTLVKLRGVGMKTIGKGSGRKNIWTRIELPAKRAIQTNLGAS